jgi:hypothetical protein
MLKDNTKKVSNRVMRSLKVVSHKELGIPASLGVLAMTLLQWKEHNFHPPVSGPILRRTIFILGPELAGTAGLNTLQRNMKLALHVSEKIHGPHNR